MDELSFRFNFLQEQFAAQYESVFPNKMAPKAVVIIPSLTLDQQILSKVEGVIYYEERMLCLLMLLRMPNTQVIYITSVPVDPVIIDYYLHLLPGITSYHARQRLTLLSCYDASPKSLTEKILERPRLLERIRKQIPPGYLSHLACFNVTEYEKQLAVSLNMPVFGCDPRLLFLGTKSGSRKVFKKCGIPVPPGFEDLRSEADICEALASLKKENPALKKAMVKMDDGFSGDGNAVYYYDEASRTPTASQIRESLSRNLHVVANDLTFQMFIDKFSSMGGIVECFIPGKKLQSPSVQCRINPLGKIEIISTHDQVLGGEDKQVFLGASFPANREYAPAIAEAGRLISEELRNQGVLGRFSVDFISVRDKEGWRHYAIEINLRKGGTTHPYLMLQFLTEGTYDAGQGMYFAANGQPRYYFTSDNLKSDQYKGLTPPDLIDIAMSNDLLYSGSSQEGVMFHLIGALSQYGKLGVVCIGSSPEQAMSYYQKTLEVLNKETRR